MYACIYSLLYIESCCYSLWTYTSQRGGHRVQPCLAATTGARMVV